MIILPYFLHRSYGGTSRKYRSVALNTKSNRHDRFLICIHLSIYVLLGQFIHKSFAYLFFILQRAMTSHTYSKNNNNELCSSTLLRHYKIIRQPLVKNYTPSCQPTFTLQMDPQMHTSKDFVLMWSRAQRQRWIQWRRWRIIKGGWW